ncbi:MAG: transposase [Bacteroidia bacterium]|nr:transposase [Bacteroidia bacterium]
MEKKWKERLHQYITGIIQRKEAKEKSHKVLQINSMPDHIHIFIGMRPHQSISSLAQNVKTEGTIWINENKLCKTSFAWQLGFGGFSYSKTHVPEVIRYIQNQEAHHKKESFLDEYRRMMKAFEIEHDEKYIFNMPK